MTGVQPAPAGARPRAWTDVQHALLAALKDRLFSVAEFQDALHDLLSLADSPCDAVVFTIDQPAPLERIEVGTVGAGPPHLQNSIELDGGQVRFTATTRVWFRTGTSQSTRDATARQLSGLLTAFWRSAERDSKANILCTTMESCRAALENAVARQVASGRTFAVVLGDLDNFKQYNSVYGMAGGDRVIGRVGAAIAAAAPKRSLVIHRQTGDEFMIVAPFDTVEAMLLEVEGVRLAVNQAIGEDDKVTTSGMSFGIATSAGQGSPTLAELEARANAALSPPTGKRRGIVSLEPGAPATDFRSDDPAGLATLVTASLIHDPRPFENVWLNLISLTVAAGILGAGTRSVVDIRNAIGMSVAQVLTSYRITTDSAEIRSLAVNGGSVSAQTSVTALDVANAATHGVARALVEAGGAFNDPHLVIRFNSQGTGAEIVLDGQTIYQTPAPNPADRSLILCSAPSSPLPSYDARRAILVKIGHEPLALPEGLFARVVTVDDRPTRGGGLPDFWEAAVAQVVEAVVAHPNARVCIVIGELASGARTLEVLREFDDHIAPTTVDAFLKRTGLTHAAVTTAQPRLGTSVISTESSQLMRVLTESINASPQLLVNPAADEPLASTRFILRELYAPITALEARDGCRVDTAAQAFPIVLDLARRVGDEVLVDQAGRSFRELIDFRIILERPTERPIPDFYADDQDRLERYVDKEFAQAGGLFQDALAAQIGPVIEHIATTVSQARPYATRRAILVVAHEPNDANLTPLGLVSIRIIPRFTERAAILHFSYTWRTVEALVGLPYSLYGSIRFAQSLTEQVREATDGRTIEGGRLSYIAHSMHLYTDPYTQAVARRIIDDVSI